MNIDIRYWRATVISARVGDLIVVAEFAVDFDIDNRRAQTFVDGNAVKLERAFPTDIFPFVRFIAEDLVFRQFQRTVRAHKVGHCVADCAVVNERCVFVIIGVNRKARFFDFVRADYETAVVFNDVAVDVKENLFILFDERRRISRAFDVGSPDVADNHVSFTCIDVVVRRVESNADFSRRDSACKLVRQRIRNKRRTYVGRIVEVSSDVRIDVEVDVDLCPVKVDVVGGLIVFIARFVFKPESDLNLRGATYVFALEQVDQNVVGRKVEFGFFAFDAVTGDYVIKSHRAALEFTAPAFFPDLTVVKADKQRQKVGVIVILAFFREVKKPCNFGLVSFIVVVFHGNFNVIRDI